MLTLNETDGVKKKREKASDFINDAIGQRSAVIANSKCSAEKENKTNWEKKKKKKTPSKQNKIIVIIMKKKYWRWIPFTDRKLRSF